MEDVLHLATQLLSCPSITPHDAGCQQLINSYLADAGFTAEYMRFENVDNLWARIGTKAPLLVFAGHTDVVPTGPEADWTSPPFSPDIRGNLLFGRGACDMKGALAAMVIAATQFVKNKPNFNGSIAFLLTSDEEGPGINGTDKVVKTLLNRDEKIDYCLIGEPSSEHQLGDQIRVGRRGSLHGKLLIHGKQGHVAYPHLATNPIHQCLNALHELTETQWDEGNEHFPATTFQITNMHAGTGAANVIPGHTDILFNLRFSTTHTIEQLQQRIENILNDHGLRYDIEWKIGGLPFLTQTGKLLTSTQKAIRDITGLETQLSTGGGTSDGRFIAPTGAEVIELGVVNNTAHQVDEHTSVDDLKKLTKIYSAILGELFS